MQDNLKVLDGFIYNKAQLSLTNTRDACGSIARVIYKNSEVVIYVA